MSEGSDRRPQDQTSSKPPKRGWEATEPFWDLKGSHWVEVALTFALLCVGAGQLAVYFRQATIMDNQASIAEAANKQNAITNRAFVTSNEVAVEEERREGVLTGWRFEPAIVNSGNTPSKGLTYYWSATYGPAKGADKILAPTYPINESPALIDPDRGFYENIDNPGFPTHLPHLVLGPHASTKMGSIELPAEHISARINEKWRRYISGTIHYRDQINPVVEHVTKFCYMIWASQMINETTPPVFELCDYWNCIDDECKEDERQYRTYVARAFKSRGESVPEDFYGHPMSFLLEPTYKKAENRAQELARDADPRKYLVEPSMDAARMRNAELWQVVRCKPQPQCDGGATTYLLEMRQLAAGTAVLVLPPNMKDGVVASNLNGTATLTKPEQAAVQSASEIGPVIVEMRAPPVVSLPDGTGAVVLPTGETSNFTPTEIASLKPDTEMGQLLPQHYRYRISE